MSSIQSLLDDRDEFEQNNYKENKQEYETDNGENVDTPQELAPPTTAKSSLESPDKEEMKDTKAEEPNFIEATHYNTNISQPSATRGLHIVVHREPKRMFRINKTFKPRKWLLVDLDVPLCSGFTIKTKVYRPENYRNLPEKKYTVVGNDSKYYLGPGIPSHSSLSHIQHNNPAQAYPPIGFYPPVHAPPQLQPIQPIGVPAPHLNVVKGKSRILCTIPNCNKDFSDRSSLNRHKKRFHPELFSDRPTLVPNHRN